MSWRLRKLDCASIQHLGMTRPDGAVTLYKLERTMPDGQRMATMFWMGECRGRGAQVLAEMKQSLRGLSDETWIDMRGNKDEAELGHRP